MNTSCWRRCCATAAALMVAGVAWAQAPDLAHMDIVLKAIPDGPVARVGKETIPPDEFRDLYIAEVTRLQRMAREEAADIERIEIAVNCLRLLIERGILSQEAQKRGITVSQQELAESWEREVRRLGESLSRDEGNPLSEEEVLNLAHTTREEGLRELRRTLLIEKMRKRILDEKGITVTDKEVAQFFEENKENARRPDMVHIKQIFIRAQATQGTRRAREDEEARAEMALKRIQAGESFAAVATSESDGALKEAGGDLGPMPLANLPDFLRESVMGMKPGELSGVIESDYGFHIVELVEVTPGEEPTLEEIAPRIRRMLLTRRGNQAVREFCSEVTEGEDVIHVYLDLEKQIGARPDLREFFAQESDDNEPPEE